MNLYRKVFPQNENNSADKNRGQHPRSIRSHTRYHDFAMRKTLWNFLSHCLHDSDNRTNKESEIFDQMQAIQNMLFDDHGELNENDLRFFIKDYFRITKAACFGYSSHTCKIMTLLNRHNSSIVIDRTQNNRLPPQITSVIEEGNADFTVRFRKMEDPDIENEIIQAAYRLSTDTLLEIKQYAKIFVPDILMQRLSKPAALAGTGVLRIRLKGSEKFFILPCRYFQHVSLRDAPPNIFGKKVNAPLNANDLRYHSISYGWNYHSKTIEPCVQTAKNIRTNVPFSDFHLNEKTIKNMSLIKPNTAINIRDFEKAFPSEKKPSPTPKAPEKKPLAKTASRPQPGGRRR
ncbi:hypothetical protein SNEBB_003331 [Seison nebaliae]|nr:hypothetical protein SNEBB_003331 [Seison nebaliae]